MSQAWSGLHSNLANFWPREVGCYGNQQQEQHRSGALHLSMKHHSAFHLIWSSVHYCVLCVSNSANIRKYYELYSIMYIFTSMHIICQIVAKLMTLQHLEICIKRSNADDQHMLSCSFLWFDQFKLRVLYYTKHFSI